MNVQPYLHHVPAINQRLKDLDPHAIVLGLGPSAWLMPWLDQELLRKPRIYGVNDCFKLWPDSPCPVKDLVIMDPPAIELHPQTERYKVIMESTPERIWIYRDNLPHWKNLMSEEMFSKVLGMDLHVFQPNKLNGQVPKLTEVPYHHIVASPAGTTTLAWHQGARRIGVIGVDLLPRHHKLSHMVPTLSWFFGHLSKQAEKLHGQIINLSPFSTIKSFEPCESMSAR